MKRKKKLLIWLGSILGALVIVVVVSGYFAINYATDKVLSSLVDPVEPLESASASPSPSDEASPTGDVNAAPSSEPSSSVTPSFEASSSPSPMPEDSKQSDNSTKTGTSETKQVSQSPKTGKKTEPVKTTSPSPSPAPTSAPAPTSIPVPASTPASTSTPLPSPSPTFTYEEEISVEKAEKVKESITFSEKTKIMTVMLKRLSPSDIKTLQELASGGLTIEQKKEAKKIILQKLTEDEYNELIAIAKKYGLSKGTSYEDSLKEDLGD